MTKSYLKTKKHNLMSDILNSVFIYQPALQKLRQNNIKITKTIFFSISFLFKLIYINLLSFVQKILYPIFIGIIGVVKILINLFSVLKLPNFIKERIYNRYSNFIFELYLYNLKILFKKRNSLLKKTTKSIVRYRKKKIYKRKYLNFLTKKLRLKFSKYARKYFMRKVKMRKKLNKQLQKRSANFSGFLYDFYSIENIFYKVENRVTYNILHILTKIEYVLSNLNKIINYFKGGKKLNLIRSVSNLYLNKFRNVMSFINDRSVLLKLFRKIDQTFYRVIIRRLYIRVHKRIKKRYIKYKFNLFALKLFLITYYLFKIILVFSIIFNNKMVYFITRKLELLFSLQGIFSESSKYLNLN